MVIFNGVDKANGVNGSNGHAMDLPDSKSPTLALVHPTEEEKLVFMKDNGVSWRGALNLDQYLRREIHLANQDFTRNGGITYWVLIDTSAKDRLVLSSCETFRKRALVVRNGKVQDVVAHGIGSVWCPSSLRRRGYAGRMMAELGKKLEDWQGNDQEIVCSVLYSDIGKVSHSLIHMITLSLTYVDVLRTVRLGTVLVFAHLAPS